MIYSSEVGGYSRSVNSHKRERLSRWLTGRLYRVVVWVGGLNTVTWGFVAYEVASWILIAFFVVMVLAWMVAFAPVGA